MVFLFLVCMRFLLEARVAAPKETPADNGIYRRNVKVMYGSLHAQPQYIKIPPKARQKEKNPARPIPSEALFDPARCPALVMRLCEKMDFFYKVDFGFF